MQSGVPGTATRLPTRSQAAGGSVALVPERGGIAQAAARADEIEPADQRRLGDEPIQRGRAGVAAGQLKLQAIDEAVVGVAQHHVDLLGRHHRDVARLLAEEQLRGDLPLAQREIAQHRHHGGGRGDGYQD
jgi:hypothetical protein